MDFQYKAKSKNGDTLRGIRAADSESDLLTWIRGNGWTPIEIYKSHRVASKGDDSDPNREINFREIFAGRVRLRDKLIFFRELATMISAGVPIAGSIEILVEQTTNRTLKRIISEVFTRVSAGVSLTNALGEHPKYFDTLALALIRSGEESGTLDVSLQRLCTFLEAQDNLRKKIISAMTYPAAVVTITIAVLGVMVTIVVPQFQKAFAHLNINMPALTLALFAFGEWARANWYFIPLTILIIWLAVHFLRKVRALDIYIDSAMLKFPVFGPIIYKSALARSFRTMSSLLASGVPVLQALALAGNVSSNEKIKRAFITIRDAAAMGIPLNVIIQEKKLFPPMVAHMIAVGEETGRTDEMLGKIADWYEAELEETVKRLSSVLEPTLVVIIGGVVGVMVLAIFLPIISAIKAFL